MNRLSLLALLLLPTLALGEDIAVYESLSDVRIGPVFLTPEQRRWLDARRDQGPDEWQDDSDGGASETTEEPEPRPTPAGFIINSNGKRSQWKGGDFEQTSSTSISDMRFPDDVKIIRHDNSAAGPDDDDETTE